jgi:hypothetical protein
MIAEAAAARSVSLTLANSDGDCAAFAEDASKVFDFAAVSDSE